MLSVTFIVCVFTRRVIACARELVLCREHFIGSAAIVAKSKYSGQKSVGDGCKHKIALWNVSSAMRGINLHWTWWNFRIDKCRSCPNINTGWFCGSIGVNVLLNDRTVLVIYSGRKKTENRKETWINKATNIKRKQLNKQRKNEIKFELKVSRTHRGEFI